MIAIADPDLSPACRSRLLEAITAVGAQLAPSDLTASFTPRLVIGGLRPGQRRLSSAVLAASERWPHIPLLVACDDELVQPVMRLHGGRLTLISQDLTAVPLGQTLATCLGWPGSDASAQPNDPSRADADAHGETADAEHEHWHVRVVLGAGLETPQATVHQGRCLSAWLRPAESTSAPVPAAALDVWSRQVIASQETVSAEILSAPVPAGVAAGIHLDPDGLALVQLAGPHWQVFVSSSQRLPTWCPLPGSQLLSTRPGDVLILAWVLDDAPVPVLSGSSRVIALELGRRWQGQAATAIVIEVR
jgi:hypothetical protein